MRFLLFLILAGIFAYIGFDKVSGGWEKAKSSTRTKPTRAVTSSVLTEAQMKFKAEYCNEKLSSLKAHCRIYIQKFNQATQPEEIISLNRDFFPPLNKFNCWEIKENFRKQKGSSATVKKYNIWLDKFQASYKKCTDEMFAARKAAIHRLNQKTLNSVRR